MIAAALSQHPNRAVYAALNCAPSYCEMLSSKNYAQAQSGGQAGSQEPTRDCSGCAADAVRNHAFPPRPAGVLRLGVGSVRLDLGAASPRAQSYRLTPARWGAMKLACQSPVPCGSGEAVPDGTTLEPLWNHQLTEIAGLFSWFHGFHGHASRDARMGTYAQSRAYMRGVGLGTLEPLKLTYVYQQVSGSTAVPTWFHLEPGRARRLANGGNARFLNILAGGYAGQLLGLGADRGRRAVIRSRAVRTFGDFSPVRGLELGRIQLLGLVDENGGFLPFLVHASGRVGRVMLEGWPERRRNQPFLGSRPLPVRLAREASPVDRPEAPPVPPFAARPAPRALAHERAGIWNGFPAEPATIVGQCWAIGTRQRLNGGIGSGLGCRGHRRAAAAGQGACFGCGLEPRRTAEIAGSFAHVN